MKNTSTSVAPPRLCSSCGRPEHGSLSCEFTGALEDSSYSVSAWPWSELGAPSSTIPTSEELIEQAWKQLQIDCARVRDEYLRVNTEIYRAYQKGLNQSFRFFFETVGPVIGNGAK